MKKSILILIAIFTTALASNAFVDNQYMLTEPFLVNTGYSAEMSKELGVIARDPYREPHTVYDERTPIDIAKKIYNYVAPGMYTDYDHYNHSIKFNTTDWRDF